MRGLQVKLFLLTSYAHTCDRTRLIALNENECGLSTCRRRRPVVRLVGRPTPRTIGWSMVLGRWYSTAICIIMAKRCWKAMLFVMLTLSTLPGHLGCTLHATQLCA